ncbi:MAG: hypothetical protein U1G07_03300 [Verrucomicrobiota bacterium]
MVLEAQGCGGEVRASRRPLYLQIREAGLATTATDDQLRTYPNGTL